MKLLVIAENIAKNQRWRILNDLVKEIESGKFVHYIVDPNKLYELHRSVRHEYLSPNEISGTNWGAARIWEMDAGMDEAF